MLRTDVIKAQETSREDVSTKRILPVHPPGERGVERREGGKVRGNNGGT